MGLSPASFLDNSIMKFDRESIIKTRNILAASGTELTIEEVEAELTSAFEDIITALAKQGIYLTQEELEETLQDLFVKLM